ncbi:MAG TPA: hypothetical protein P5320_02475 [Bacteroidales bacterium]|nr:hypothetical protein [Bacteroidales bacterium]HOK74890.1 hypothetical protein [Bacteroidales bacterium]HOM40207.1 hypothetical protein [Bacteroidales bacterium]HPP91704.1 hypothetical protein [Bacteroidales bacterium]HQK69927.1 hypothetical protein [Bacteroidales bacterium]
METKELKKNLDFFAAFELTNEEMLTIKGGDIGDPTPVPPQPPKKY